MALAALWEIGARSVNSPAFVPFSRTLVALWRLIVTGEAARHASVSLAHICIGYLAAAVIGSAVGTAITEWRAADLALTPVIDAMRPVAALTIFPLLIVILGLGVKSKAFVIFWTAWPAIVLNTVHGLRNVDREVIEAAQLDGASDWLILCHMKFPLALGTIVTGLRIGLSGGYISLVSAEMLGSTAGLGYSILAYSQTFRFAEMYAVIIVIALLGLSMNAGLGRLQKIIEGA